MSNRKTKSAPCQACGSAVVYHGPSMIDGAPIVAIVTNIVRASHNPKTGPMSQLYILRADVDPIVAIQSGADVSICGRCGHRGNKGKARSCYVSVLHAPASIYRAFRRGSYATMAPELVALQLRARGRNLRLGAYGDPAALPEYVLRYLTNVIPGHTGYTHSWRSFPQLAPYLMASVDSAAEAAYAQSLGWRYFRTRAPEQPLRKGEIACPAAEESGKRSACDRCRLCNGATAGDRRANIAIVVHGNPVVVVHALNFIRSNAAAAA